MKRLKKVLTGTGILVVILLIVATLFVNNIAKSGLPDYNEDITLHGIIDEVVIYRDKYAIPHIYAKNSNDLYIAVGYVVAQDRMWQMDLLRRVTLGRLSEIFGKDFAETDLLLRSLEYSEKSKRVIPETSPEVLRALEAFTSGVNQYIDRNLNNLPFEFRVLGYKPEPWDIIHSFNLIGYMAWDLKSGWSEVLLDKIKAEVGDGPYQDLLPPDLSSQHVPIPGFHTDVPGFEVMERFFTAANKLSGIGLEVFNASNSWAVSGEKSETGLPLLANDMHLSYSTPGIWYQIHQVIEDSLNVSGVLLPGAPVVVAGHNENIAWGMTNVVVENVDFYEEKVNPDNPGQYLYMDEWHEFRVKKEIIKIDGDDDQEHEIKFTHRGPVISDHREFNGRTVSMKWIGNEYSNEVSSVYQLNRARNWDEFKEALTTFLAVSQNINYADVNGNIGMFCAAGIPVRKRDDALYFLPGWTDEYDWKGLVPFEELPYTYNPPSGYILSANTKVVDENYPHYIGKWFALPNRYNRIKEMLEEKEIFTVQDFKTMQTDFHSKLAEKAVPDLLNIIEKKIEGDEHYLKILREWDYNYGVESPGAALFEVFFHKFIENVFKGRMGEGLFSKYLGVSSLPKYGMENVWNNPGSEWFDDTDLGNNISFQTVVVQSFSDAIDELVQLLGNDPTKWQWGKIHTFTLEHPIGSVRIMDRVFKLNRGPYPVGGTHHTVSPYSYPFDALFKVDHGASQRHIYSLADWDRSLTIIPTGNSGIPGSKHYCDQTELFIIQEYHNENFSFPRVEQATIYKMVISPLPGN